MVTEKRKWKDYSFGGWKLKLVRSSPTSDTSLLLRCNRKFLGQAILPH
jgi:hypothetical protein